MIFRSRFMPCEACGASIDRAAPGVHECSPSRWADYQMFRLGNEVADLDAGVRRYLATASGRFESWLAARQVRDQA